MMETRKVLILDVDNTVCPRDQPPSGEMIQKLNSIIEKGIIVVFISGRDKENVYSRFSKYLSRGYYIISNTGTQCFLVGEEPTLIHQHLFTEIQREEIKNAVNKIISSENITGKGDLIKETSSQITFCAPGCSSSREERALFDPQKDKRKRWVLFLKQKLGRKYTFSIAGDSSIDIVHSNKRKGISAFLEHVNIPRENVLFVGDEFNEGGNDECVVGFVDCVKVNSPDHTLELLKQLYP